MMSDNNYFDQFVGDFDMFNSHFMKNFQRMMNKIKGASKNGKLKGKWEINPIDRPGVKGYTVRGYFGASPPLEPLDPFSPFEPLDPMKRRPVPKRLFEIQENSLKENREPLVDVFDEENAIKIYVEMPGKNKDDIQLNVTAEKVEIKAANFYKMIDLPTKNIDLTKVSSKYKNGVLEIDIPKKDEASEKDAQKISVQ